MSKGNTSGVPRVQQKQNLDVKLFSVLAQTQVILKTTKVIVTSWCTRECVQIWSRPQSSPSLEEKECGKPNQTYQARILLWNAQSLYNHPLLPSTCKCAIDSEVSMSECTRAIMATCTRTEDMYVICYSPLLQRYPPIAGFWSLPHHSASLLSFLVV